MLKTSKLDGYQLLALEVLRSLIADYKKGSEKYKTKTIKEIKGGECDLWLQLLNIERSVFLKALQKNDKGE